MKLARGLERRLERLVDGLASRIFRGDLHPVELANRLVREADLALRETKAGPTIPNQYIVSLSPDDIASEEALAPLGNEMALAIEDTAIDRGWRLEGPVVVQLKADRAVAAGSWKCRTSTRAGPMPAWAYLLDTTGSRKLPLRHIRSRIGRAVDVDVNIPEDHVSRYQALLWREGGEVWIEDLGSRNGTYHNGHKIEETVRVNAEDVLAFGSAAFVFRPA
jgi:hypothetical protein